MLIYQNLNKVSVGIRHLYVPVLPSPQKRLKPNGALLMQETVDLVFLTPTMVIEFMYSRFF